MIETTLEVLARFQAKCDFDRLIAPSTNKIPQEVAEAGAQRIRGAVPRDTGATAASLAVRATSGGAGAHSMGAIVSIGGAAGYQEFGTSRGVRPRRFFRTALAQMGRQLGTVLERAAREIESRWSA